MDANRATPGYELESELSRVSLHATDRDPNRKLAWVNSICILFFLIGVFGSKPASIRIKPLPPVEEVIAAIVEPLPPPPQTRSEQLAQEQNNQEQVDTPQAGVVTPEPRTFTFSSRTIGNPFDPNALP